MSDQTIDRLEDIPADQRALFIECVQSARHVDEIEIRNLHAKLRAARAVCAERERELLKLKGPCSGAVECRLHYAHAGPCDTRTLR